MNIVLINGSPKSGESTSGLLIKYLIPRLENQQIEVIQTNKLLTNTQYEKITHCDVLVFAFPLYVDSIPSSLLRVLEELEIRGFAHKTTKVYCICNNGFFEGTQTQIAIEQMKLWCAKVNLTWGQAIGTGAGEMLPIIKDIPLGHGPNKNLGEAIEILAAHIISGNSGNDMLICVNYPRLLWRIQASLLVWLPRAKKNGLHKYDLYRKRD